MSLLEVNNLSYIYGKNTPYEKCALKNINFSINRGEILGVAGHSGSGKSTLSQLLNGLLKPSFGSVKFNGVDIGLKPKNIKKIRFKIGLVFQYPEHQLFAETVYKDIAFGAVNMGLDNTEIDRRVKESCNVVDLPLSVLDKSPFSLSGGEKRRVALAGVLCMYPDVLILDEPTSSLDPIGRDTLLTQIVKYKNRFNCAIIFISHNMQELANIADRILVIKEGEQIALDTPSNIFSDDNLLYRCGIVPPQITTIIKNLINMGYPLKNNIITVEDALKCFVKLLNGGDSNGC